MKNYSILVSGLIEAEGKKFDKTAKEVLIKLNQEGIQGLLTNKDDRGWIRKKPGYFREVFLKSKGHVLLCEKLAKEKVMFSFELPTIIPDDREFSNRQYRKLDLLVIKNERAIIVEIDGRQHYDHELFDEYDVQKQREDDNLRD